MANNNYDHLIKLGVDRSEVNRVITDLNTAFGKQYKLKIDVSDLTEAAQTLANLSKTAASAAAPPDAQKNQADAAKIKTTAEAADTAAAQIKTALGNIDNWISSTNKAFDQVEKKKKEILDLKNNVSGLS